MQTARSLHDRDSYVSLIDLLQSRAQRHPDRKLLISLNDAGEEESVWSYAELDRRARAIAALLQRERAAGKRALLLFPPGPEFVAALVGCIYAGAVAVSTYPPDPLRLADTLPGFLAVSQDARADYALTTAAILPMLTPLFALSPELGALRWLETDRLEPGFEAAWAPPALDASALCLLQYTSGSTGDPKGVMFTHANVMAQSAATRAVTGLGPEDVTVSWIPLYHSMGIGAVAQTVLTSGSLVMMSPLAFLQRPAIWLRAVSKYRAAFSMAPNFAYDLCARQVTAAEKVDLDLSAWRMAVCGSEPVQEETLDRFAQAFAGCGFRREALTVGYGLTETSLGGSCGEASAAPAVRGFQPAALESRRVIEVAAGESRRMVSCGRVSTGLNLKIVNPDNRVECVRGEVGEIWISGPSVASGYWNKPEETEATFQAYLEGTGEGPFLRTGDLGFLYGGELFVSGRRKDLIIIRGRNHHPLDIERSAAASHPALEEAVGAAFSVEREGEERLVLLQELGSAAGDPPALIAEIRKAIARRHGLKPAAILLLAAGALPRTRNQKIPRYACRQLFLTGALSPVAEWREAEPAAVSAAPAHAIPRQAEDLEAWLRARLAARFRTEPTGLDFHLPLSSYGLDSLGVVELSGDIARDLGIPVLIQELLESSSIGALLARLRDQWPERSCQAEGGLDWDLAAEAVLDPAITGRGQAAVVPGEPKAVFLTGATGFLGAFLLRELLRETSARIFCLVRAPDAETGLGRIRANLESFGIWEQNFGGRIVPVLGDLAAPLLGLSPAAFDGLAAELDVIYHGGAVVNFIYPYRDLKAANVLGTQEILRLAARGRLKPVHHVSTLSVFPLEGHPEGRIYFEDEELPAHRAHLNGYAQSKWVADKMAAIARTRDIPVAIYRVGEVTGHSRSGVCPAQRDASSLILKGCLQLGIVPDLNLLLHTVPVDYVAAGLLHLSRQPDSLGKVFHLTHPEPIRLSQFYDFLAGLGYRLQRLGYAEWMEKVGVLLDGAAPSALRAFAPLLRSAAAARIGRAEGGLRMDCSNALAGLESAAMPRPPEARQTWEAYFSFLQRSGFLEVPK